VEILQLMLLSNTILLPGAIIMTYTELNLSKDVLNTWAVIT